MLDLRPLAEGRQAGSGGPRVLGEGVRLHGGADPGGGDVVLTGVAQQDPAAAFEQEPGLGVAGPHGLADQIGGRLLPDRDLDVLVRPDGQLLGLAGDPAGLLVGHRDGDLAHRVGQVELQSDRAHDQGESDQRRQQEAAVGELHRDLAGGDDPPGGRGGRTGRGTGGRGRALRIGRRLGPVCGVRGHGAHAEVISR
ncbi:hypothetical protein QFZ56_003874 [Streptomyces achromogenes]|uniref:Uncharacterized protein n=1 Tax=Streptomyces achromogenes TaxID=67255 RepID=A0ABU0Q414_STRAH|nr:hypothetical protein [Streptomyces achromogenes]MDQ0684911.1 hypothetical protein [Streptomyces achromogenes]